MKPLKTIILVTIALLTVTTLSAVLYYKPREPTNKKIPIEGFASAGMIVLPSNLFSKPEQAKSLGFKGVLKVEFPEDIAQLLIVSKLHPYNLRFKMSFVSFYDNVTYVKVVLGSKDHDVGFMDSMLGDYTTFLPNGTLTIKTGEVVEANMTLAVPSSLSHGMSFPRSLLGGYGFGLEHGFVMTTNFQDDPAYPWQ